MSPTMKFSQIVTNLKSLTSLSPNCPRERYYVYNITGKIWLTLKSNLLGKLFLKRQANTVQKLRCFESTWGFPKKWWKFGFKYFAWCKIVKLTQENILKSVQLYRSFWGWLCISCSIRSELKRLYKTNYNIPYGFPFNVLFWSRTVF